jgi:hypothetical protein
VAEPECALLRAILGSQVARAGLAPGLSQPAAGPLTGPDPFEAGTVYRYSRARCGAERWLPCPGASTPDRELGDQGQAALGASGPERVCGRSTAPAPVRRPLTRQVGDKAADIQSPSRFENTLPFKGRLECAGAGRARFWIAKVVHGSFTAAEPPACSRH